MSTKCLGPCRKNPRLMFWLSSIGFWLLLIGTFMTFFDDDYLILAFTMIITGSLIMIVCLVIQMKLRKEIRNTIHPMISPPGMFGFPLDHTPARNPNQQIVYTYQDARGNTVINMPYTHNNRSQRHNTQFGQTAVLQPGQQIVHPVYGLSNQAYVSSGNTSGLGTVTGAVIASGTAPHQQSGNPQHSGPVGFHPPPPYSSSNSPNDDYELNVINSMINESDKRENASMYTVENDLPPSYETLSTDLTKDI